MTSVVMVPYEEEIPRHCPMCGADADFEDGIFFQPIW